MTTKQYREVKRKAAVGERIKVVVGGTHGDGHHNVGDILYVIYADRWSDGSGVSVSKRNYVADSWIAGTGINHGRYVVLEPITEPAAPSPLGTSFLQSDPLYAAFRQLVLDNADAIRAILPQLSAEPPVRVAPVKLTRAEVIAKATADVAELLRIGRDYDAVLPEGAIFVRRNFDVTFYVNRDKRAVTALIRKVNPYGKAFGRVVAKATSKCAPDDVFHAEIGKAIALRRALGLAVPTEYTDAPKPDEPRVGAKVFSATSWGTFTIAEDVSIAKRRMTSECYAGLRDCDVHGSPRILDDTDVDYSVNADSTVSPKGVAA